MSSSREHRYPHVDREIAIGPRVARNRIMMSTHGPRLPQPRYLRYLEERAAGGIGLAGFNLGPLGLMQFPLGPGVPAIPSMEPDAIPLHPLTAEGRRFYDTLVPTAREWASAVKRQGVLAVGQLYHPGAAQHSDNFQPTVAPSTVADEYERHRPHPLSGDEIADLVDAYALCARRALEAGYDAVEIHAAHGYLVQQFLSPLTNRRSDDWGGSLSNRLRFLLAIIGAVRAAVDDGIGVGIRLTGEEPEGGLTLDDLVVISREVEAAGAAYVNISGGSYSGLWRGARQAYVASALMPAGPNVPISARIKRAVGIPVMVGGSIATVEQADRIIANGDADVIGMVRALVADPHLVAKALRGEPPRRCIAGNECHYGRPIICAVNPAAGREDEMRIEPAASPRRVLVVGAGPAGIECAIWAAERGHIVTLADRSAEIGGALAVLARTSRQSRFADYLEDSRRRLAGSSVDLRLSTAVDPAAARALAPDVLVLATGARHSPAIGMPALDALAAGERLGPAVTIVGGTDDHLPPLVTAAHFATTRRVTLLVETPSPGTAIEPASLYALMRQLHEANVRVLPFTAATALDADVLHVRDTLTNAAGRIDEVGDVIDVGSRTADGEVAARFAGVAAEIHVIGDALSPRRMLHATLDGSRLGNQIA